MKQQIKAMLGSVAEDIFGKLAFIFAFAVEDRAPLEMDQCTGGSVTFSGPISGRLSIFITTASLAELAGNMLGIEKEEAGLAHQDDALKELSNVVCGNLLPKIAGKDAIFQVAPPSIIQNAEVVQPREDAFNCMASMSLDDGECDLYLVIDEGLPDHLADDLVEDGNNID